MVWTSLSGWYIQLCFKRQITVCYQLNFMNISMGSTLTSFTASGRAFHSLSLEQLGAIKSSRNMYNFCQRDDQLQVYDRIQVS